MKATFKVVISDPDSPGRYFFNGKVTVVTGKGKSPDELTRMAIAKARRQAQIRNEQEVQSVAVRC